MNALQAWLLRRADAIAQSGPLRALGRATDAWLSRPEGLRTALVLAWGGFVLCGVLVAAFCFSYLFLSPGFYLPIGVLELFMLVAGLRLLSVALGSLHDRRAALAAAAGRIDEAANHYRWALRMTPGNPDIFCHWGLALRRNGDPDQALELFERAATLDPDNDEPYVQQAALALELGDWRRASRLFDQAYRLRRGVAWNDLPERVPAGTPAPPANGPIETSVSKLNHDAQQLGFLLEGRYLPERFRPLQLACQELLRETLGEGQGPELKLNAQQASRIQLLYGRNVHISPVPAFPREVLNPDLETAAIEAQYLKGEPALVVIDDFLQPDACEALLHFCQKSTIWHDDARPGGYLGAYMDDGFSCDLLYQIAHDLRDALPQVFRGLPLKHMWAYKYDSRKEGIGIHADGAAVNVNFWITPDQANLEPESGGLLIYPVKAPPDWDFKDYNQDTAKAEAAVAGSEPIRVSYRQNRAVVFDSRLFHATDRFRFRDEYLLRRINITLLYGR